METVELEIEMGNELVSQAHNLAIRYFGDDSDTSLSKILELAFKMRCLFSDSVASCQDEIDEPVSRWEFTESSSQNVDSIQSWLFRKK